MLVLSRRPGESIRIKNDVEVTVLEVRGKRVRLGIRAPHRVPVYREEVYDLRTDEPVNERLPADREPCEAAR